MSEIQDKNPVLAKAHEAYEKFTGDKKALEMAQNRERGRRKWRSLEAYYRKEGRAEDARRMKAKGYPISDIAEITGLSEEEIQGL